MAEPIDPIEEALRIAEQDLAMVTTWLNESRIYITRQRENVRHFMLLREDANNRYAQALKARAQHPVEEKPIDDQPSLFSP